jgi:hypothetical protein
LPADGTLVALIPFQALLRVPIEGNRRACLTLAIAAPKPVQGAMQFQKEAFALNEYGQNSAGVG